MYDTLKAFLGNPLVIIASVILGTILGINSPETGQFLRPVGEIFMSVLELTLIPIIFAAITLSVSRLFSFHESSHYVRKIIATFLVAMLGVSFLTVLLAVILDPASSILQTDNPELRNISISASFVERSTLQPVNDEGVRNLSAIIIDAIPNNIFRAFSEGKALQVLVFSVILGVAVGNLEDKKRQKVEHFAQTVLNIFHKIIMAIIVWLPIAIFSLMAAEATSVGIDTLFNMSLFVVDAYLIFIIFFVIATFIVSRSVKQSFMKVLSSLQKVIFIAFGTRSAIAAIPYLIVTFEKNFKCDPSLTKLLVPLGAVVGRFGNIIYSALCVIFIAGIYQTDLGTMDYVTIVLLSVVAGLSSTGATGILTLGLLTIVLNPLQLPLGAVLPLLIAVDAIIDPVRTLLLVQLNAAVISTITNPDVKIDSSEIVDQDI